MICKLRQESAGGKLVYKDMSACPGCQILFYRGFRFLSSLYSDPREKLVVAVSPLVASHAGVFRELVFPPAWEATPLMANTENSRCTREKPLVPRVTSAILIMKFRFRYISKSYTFVTLPQVIWTKFIDVKRIQGNTLIKGTVEQRRNPRVHKCRQIRIRSSTSRMQLMNVICYCTSTVTTSQLQEKDSKLRGSGIGQ